MIKIFDTDPREVKHARYIFVPKGHKNGGDVFLPEERVNKRDLDPAICLEYNGYPDSYNKMYKFQLSHDGKSIMSSVGRPVPANETFEDFITVEVDQLLKEARKYYDSVKFPVTIS